MQAILTLNAGSSTIKFGVYRAEAEPELLWHGQVDNLGPVAQLQINGDGFHETREIGPADHAAGVTAILLALEPLLQSDLIVGVGHRIVHGGQSFEGPTVLDDHVLAQLETLSSLAPLHQPHNLAAVRAARTAFPGAQQIGCFDTSFHVGHPFVNDAFAIPRRFYEKGVRRYGFHGLSYDYITGKMAEDFPDLAAGRVVIAHLGNGASMCAVANGKSIGSTMGFSALDGLPMGTRCGQLDPGVLLYLMEQGHSTEAITHILYKKSGLLGLSEISHDMRTLLESDDPRAREAIDYYVFRIRRELGAMAAVLGGVDAVVFCGGIGENAAPIRQSVLDGMGFLNIHLDAEANAQNATVISDGGIPVLVIPTDEERVIARAVGKALS
ncbi:acetate/propionate family kinase [Ruegeria sp. R13_0]|uniref:acetate/propionate family kinase n=1 Tax=Ruegeria sp. R13_0 TaxID=2821099 RepID=UPI001ADCF969|nr:acetate/propionate family kinase [Ruegeria sp. R13_0]MBO9435736.1 acetate/propionate family kinase [Ruegeria sp. R13_0]